MVDRIQGFGGQQTTINGYKISDVDDASDPVYIGYVNGFGAWYILEITTDTDFRYFKGDSDYPTNWNNRASLAYDYYNIIF